MAILNGILGGAGEGGEGDGNTYVDLTTWASRPAGTEDGELGQGPNGALYRWSSDLGEWIQAHVWDRATTITKDNELEGDVVPASEGTAWTEVKAGGGAITSDGTRVTFDSSAANSDTSGCRFSHAQTAANHILIGHVQVTGVTGASNYLRWEIRNGERSIIFDIGGVDSSGNVRAVTTTPAEIGNRLSNAALSTEKWVELYVIAGSTPAASEGVALLYVDHEFVATADVADFSTSTAEEYLIGDFSSAASGVVKARDVKAGRWT